MSLYCVVPGLGNEVFRAAYVRFAPSSRKLNCAFVMVASPTTATESDGTLFEPPPQPAARTTTASSRATGRKRSSFIRVLMRSGDADGREAERTSAFTLPGGPPR